MRPGAKRKLSAAFNALPQDQECLKRTWRGSEHTDWTLILGHEEYRIHKVIVATGDQASHFLAAAFRLHCGKRESTDLTDLVPQRCWQNFEAVLEFLYTGAVNITVENWASMVKMADVLQIVSLWTKCIEVGSDLCTTASAPRLSADAVELQLPVDLEDQVLQLVIEVIAPAFMSYEAKDLTVIPIKVLQQILRRSDLEVPNEDEVFKLLVILSNEFCDHPDFPELWKCCRLEELSQESVLEAAQVPQLPKEAFVWALARRSHIWSPQARPLPAPTWACDWVGSGVRGRQILFRVQSPLDYQTKRFLRSPEHQLDDKFKWSLLVFPMGTESTGTGGHPRQVAAFVELIPEAAVVGETWTLKGVRYEITLVNWKDEQRNITKEHLFTFSNKEVDNGWHRGWATPDVMTHANGWLNESGELTFRASLCARQAVFQQQARP